MTLYPIRDAALILALGLGLGACGGDGNTTIQGTSTDATTGVTGTSTGGATQAPTTGGATSSGSGGTTGVAGTTSSDTMTSGPGTSGPGTSGSTSEVATDTTMGLATGTTGAETGGSSSTGAAMEELVPVLPSAGCGLAGSPVGHFDGLKTNVDGVDRSYDLFVPNPYDLDRPHAVIFSYHGVGGIANTNLFKLDTFSTAKNGFSINVAPQGWTSLEWAENHFVPFNLDASLVVFDQVLDELAAKYCVDLNRVFVIGSSNGAQMAFHLGCLRGDRIRAVFPFGGRCFSYGPGVCDPAPLQCSGEVMVMSVMGEDDVERHADEEATLAGFVARQGCGAGTEAVVPAPCLGFTGCDAGAEVTSCRIPGLGHQIWKDGLDDIYGVMMAL